METINLLLSTNNKIEFYAIRFKGRDLIVLLKPVKFNILIKDIETGEIVFTDDFFNPYPRSFDTREEAFNNAISKFKNFSNKI